MKLECDSSSQLPFENSVEIAFWGQMLQCLQSGEPMVSKLLAGTSRICCMFNISRNE
jgi:hypothetical protein